MEFKQSQIITLKNGAEFIVVDKIKYNDKEYLSIFPTSEPYILTVVTENDNRLEPIIEKQLLSELTPIFIKQAETTYKNFKQKMENK